MDSLFKLRTNSANTWTPTQPPNEKEEAVICYVLILTRTVPVLLFFKIIYLQNVVRSLLRVPNPYVNDYPKSKLHKRVDYGWRGQDGHGPINIGEKNHNVLLCYFFNIRGIWFVGVAITSNGSFYLSFLSNSLSSHILKLLGFFFWRHFFIKKKKKKKKDY
jgi:hypothetical protein